MSDFFREVDEEVRRDRALLIWQKYQIWFLGAALLVVAVSAGWRIYDHYRTQAEETAGAHYQAAMLLVHDGKSAEAQTALDALAKTAPAGYRALALLGAADGQAGHDPAAAIKDYDALAEDSGFDASLRDVARLRAAMLRIDHDTPKEVENRLAPLAAESFAYHDSIRELLALAAFQRNDDEAAGRWLDQIVVDPRSPPALRRRAEAFLGLVRGSAPVAK